MLEIYTYFETHPKIKSTISFRGDDPELLELCKNLLVDPDYDGLIPKSLLQKTILGLEIHATPTA